MTLERPAPSDRAIVRVLLIVAGVVLTLPLVAIFLGTGWLLALVVAAVAPVGVRFGPRAYRHLAGSPDSRTVAFLAVLVVIVIGLALVVSNATYDYCDAAGSCPGQQGWWYQAQC